VAHLVFDEGLILSQEVSDEGDVVELEGLLLLRSDVGDFVNATVPGDW
jgi:hypothetical protein